MRVISNAADKEGCLLVQFPPSLSASYMHKLGQLLDCIQQTNTSQKWKVAVEFRNRTWYTDEVTDLLCRYNSNLVIHDLPASAAPLEETTADFVYLRFHGPNGGYRGSYADDFLSEYAYYINDWTVDGKTVFIHFNNTTGDAVKNLITLNNFLKELENN